MPSKRESSRIFGAVQRQSCGLTHAFSYAEAHAPDSLCSAVLSNSRRPQWVESTEGAAADETLTLTTN